MVINSGCVTLRAIEDRDFELLYRMMQSPEIERAMGHCTLPISENQHREWIRNYRNTDEQIRLMIELENGKTIGVIMLFDINLKDGTAEVGYKVDAPVEDRIKGDITDAIKGIVEYAFNHLRLNCVCARTIGENIPSEKVLKKCNFIEEATLRQRVYQDGVYLDAHVFSVLRDEFFREKKES